MSAKRYAWEAVESLRRGHRTQAELALARAQTELQQAQAELARVEQTLHAQREAATGSTLLSAIGESSGLELQRAAMHATRQAEDEKRLQAACVLAAARVREREAALERTRQSLAHARGSERVIERDRERWEGEQRRELEREELLEVEERGDIDRASRIRR